MTDYEITIKLESEKDLEPFELIKKVRGSIKSDDINIIFADVKKIEEWSRMGTI